MRTKEEILKELSVPFPIKEIKFRAGATNANKTKALALAYIDARTIMERLDSIVGPDNWTNRYDFGPNGEIICYISIRFYSEKEPSGAEWITKGDGAEQTQIEAVKGGLSDSFKRAAVMWGLGRYLYDFPQVWVDAEQKGRSLVLKTLPAIPSWMYPPGEQPQGRTQGVVPNPEYKEGSATKKPETKHQTSSDPQKPETTVLPDYSSERYTRALGYTVPKEHFASVGQRRPQKDKTIGDLVGNISGRKVLDYLAGNTEDKAGAKFSPADDEISLQNAARYALTYREKHGKTK